MVIQGIRRSKLLPLALVTAFVGGCRRGPITAENGSSAGLRPRTGRPPVTVPLHYRPTQTRSGVYAPVRASVFVQALDERAQKDAIGQNTEKSEAVSVVTEDEPADFVKGVVVRQLQSLGAAVTNRQAGSSAQLVLRLTNFWVNETNRYNAEVTMLAQVLDAKGQKRWEGVVTGSGSNFGRSLKVVNYQETFSNAAMQAADKLLSDRACAAALAARDEPPAPPAPAASTPQSAPTAPASL